MVTLSSRRSWTALVFTLLFAGGLTAAMTFSASVEEDEDTPPADGTSSEDVEAVPPMANTENAAFLLRLGLGADTLAAAGVTPSEVSTMAAAVYSAVDESGTTLEALDAAYAAARRTVDPLRRKVRSGQGSPEDVRTLASSKVTLSEAEARRDTYIEGLRADALLTLRQAARDNLSQMWDNRQWRSIPKEFLVVERTQAEWVLLRDDLGAERIAAKNGEPCSPETATHLAACRSASAVSEAKVDLDTYHASVQSAWNTAVE